MCGPGRDWSSSGGYGYKHQEEKEYVTTPTRQHFMPSLICDTVHNCTTPSPSASITTAAHHISINPCERHPSLSSDSRTDFILKQPPKASCASRILTCCQPPAQSACCASEHPPQLRSMSSHNHHHSDRRPSNDEHGTGAPTHRSSTQTSSTYCSHDHGHKDDMLRGHVDADDEDVERGPATFERVVLIVSGLKCGCCDTGLSKALEHIPAIRNHQVNVVLAKVEFDLDMGRLSVAEVISQLHKTTGYTFEQHDQVEGQVLDLLVSDPSEISRAGRPYGVTLVDSAQKPLWSPSMLWSGRSSAVPPEISAGDRPTLNGPKQEKGAAATLFMHPVRIHHDAKQIGARDVFEYYQQLAPSQNLQLAPAGAPPTLAIGAQQTKRACAMFLVTLLFTVPVLVFAWAPIDRKRLVYAHVSLALATVIQIIATKEFVPGALQTLFHSRLFEMDFLIAMSTTIAYLFSVVSYVYQVKGKPLETGSFFETSTLLVTLILLGRTINEFARYRAAKSVSIRSLQTQDALLVISGGHTASGGETRKIDARLLQYGDHFKVLPHSKIVTDGKVIYGGSEVDESMITGEAIPVAKGLDNKVHAGTTNGSGQLIVALTKLPHENSISRIATMVESAELSKPKVQALANRIAALFVPVIAIIGITVFFIWMFVDRYRNHRVWGDAVIKAITYAIATLIISCPCAIGLAVPMVVLIAGGTAARFGIIFRDPQKLEVARSATDIVFDKTGTLTTGALSIVEGKFHGTHHKQTKSIILGLLQGDKHPIAATVYRSLDDGEVVPTRIIDIRSEPGNGIIGTCEQSKIEVRAGNPQWLGVSVLESRHTLLCVTISGVLSATFRLEDGPRVSAEKVVESLTNRGIKVHMISGDSQGAVDATAHALNIPKTQTRWRLKPIDKQRYIHQIQKDGGIVVFCGDGTNDSAALKQADVGVHINHGSDVAKSASDVVLMMPHLHLVLVLLDISKAAYRRIMMNFSWSAIYNVVAVLMAAGAFVKVRIEPAYAGLGELVSVLPVVFIAFQLRWKNYGRKYRAMQYP